MDLRNRPIVTRKAFTVVVRMSGFAGIVLNFEKPPLSLTL